MHLEPAVAYRLEMIAADRGELDGPRAGISGGRANLTTLVSMGACRRPNPMDEDLESMTNRISIVTEDHQFMDLSVEFTHQKQ